MAVDEDSIIIVHTLRAMLRKRKLIVHDLFVTDAATIKAKRFICILKESRVTLSFVVKSKLVTVLSLFLLTFLQLPLAASMILGLNYARSDSIVVI